MIWSVIGVLFLTWLLYKLFKDEFTSLRKIPKPSGSLPVFGHGLTFLRQENHAKLLQDWSEKYGPIIRYNRGFGDSRVLLTDPELIKYVVVTNAKNYRRSEFVRQVLPSIGNGLFSSNGKDHAFQRKLITPAFHFSNLVGMVEHFEDVAHNLVQLWTEQVNSSKEGVSEASISVDLTHLTLDIIGRCAFGYNFDTVLSGESEVSNAFSDVILEINFARLMRQKLIPLYKYLPLPDNVRARKGLELTDKTVLEVRCDWIYYLKIGSISKYALGIDAVHYSPKYWKDPHAFNPQRFDENDENYQAHHPYAFLPFSAGPRSCIGSKFAMAEMKAVLSTLLRHLTFEEIPGFTVRPVIRLTAKPDPPLRLRIRKLTS
ncbi:cytochrome P450 4F5-like [Pocillopora damicornis]|uniref:cytochrome P450 4F5-like n=1 Tax=Pocillopora damicornis TaxID=46731 RepID=UPI000F551A17|nr:cytochrome P450 4F5-like [Pocillopora damicornis]